MRRSGDMQGRIECRGRMDAQERQAIAVRKKMCAGGKDLWICLENE